MSERENFFTLLRPKSLSKFERFSGGIRKVWEKFTSGFDCLVTSTIHNVLLLNVFSNFQQINTHNSYQPPHFIINPWYIFPASKSNQMSHHVPKYRSVCIFLFVGCEIVVGGRKAQVDKLLQIYNFHSQMIFNE